jgi:hypothetical protein
LNSYWLNQKFSSRLSSGILYPIEPLQLISKKIAMESSTMLVHRESREQ